MLQAIFFSDSLSDFFGFWTSSIFKLVLACDLIAAFAGALLGFLAAEERSVKVVLWAVQGAGWMLFLQSLLFGVGSEAWILVPYLGEALVVGSLVALAVLKIREIR